MASLELSLKRNLRKKLLIILAISLLVFPIVNATINSIDYPYNNQILTSPTIDLQFTKTGTINCYWNYNNVHNNSVNCLGDVIRLPQVTGNYTIYVLDNISSMQYVNVSLILPPENTQIVFMLLSVILSILMLLTLFNTIGAMKVYDADLLDITYSFSIYFAVLMFNYFNMEFFGDELIDIITNRFMYVGVFSHLLFPVAAFIFSLIKQNLEFKEENQHR